MHGTPWKNAASAPRRACRFDAGFSLGGRTLCRAHFSKSSRLPLVVFLVVLLVLIPLPLLHAAQKHAKSAKPYALIFGTVWGPDDRPIYGVKVKIRRSRDKKPKWELLSNHSGEFAQRVPAGEADYVLSADLKDLKPSDGKPLHLVKEVTVHVNNDERVDTGLHLTR